jgi:MraZ protein
MWEKVARRQSRRSTLMDEVEQMFLGQHHHSMDNKGRLTIPSRFRDLLLSDGAYLTQGFDHNLMLLTEPLFMRIYERVNRISMTDPIARAIKRFIFSSAERMEFDKVGRILIPEFLRQTAGLNGEAVVVGVGDYVEIWEPGRWNSQVSHLQDDDANYQRFAMLDLSA